MACHLALLALLLSYLVSRVIGHWEMGIDIYLDICHKSGLDI